MAGRGTSQSYLYVTYTETFLKITKDEAGLRQKFFRQPSLTRGHSSHFRSETLLPSTRVVS